MTKVKNRPRNAYPFEIHHSVFDIQYLLRGRCVWFSPLQAGGVRHSTLFTKCRISNKECRMTKECPMTKVKRSGGGDSAIRTPSTFIIHHSTFNISGRSVVFGSGWGGLGIRTLS